MRIARLFLALCIGVPAASADSLFVSCEDEGVIAVVDTQSGAVARWPVGKRPRGILLGKDGSRLYVALSGSPKVGPGMDESAAPPPDRLADGIGELDARSGKLLRVLPSGQDPESFDLSSDGKTLFVSNEETAQASLVDLPTATIRATVAVGGEPEGVRLRPDGRFVYVTSEADGLVFAIDTARRAIASRIPVPARPRGVVFSADGRRAYVSSENGHEVTIVDAHRHVALGRIAIPNDGVTGTLGARPMGLALTANGQTLYVANGRGGTVSVVDTGAAKVVHTISDVGARPWGLALSGDQRTLYAANGPSNDVTVIDVVARKVARKIPACRGPWGLALQPRY
jgi:YVTN family beta-propeller protein